MKAQPSFEATPEFEHFREVMKRLIVVPKGELDQAVKAHEEKSKKRRSAKRRAGRETTTKS
jgi:hypothetical protein